MRASLFLLAGLLSLANVSYGAESPPSPGPVAGTDGSMALPGFSVPYSTFASPESLKRFREMLVESKQTPGWEGGIEAPRRFYDQINAGRAERMKKLYPVKLSTQTIAG